MELTSIKLKVTGKMYKGSLYDETFENEEYIDMTDNQLISNVKKIYRSWNNSCDKFDSREIVSITKVKVFKEESQLL